MLQLLLLLAKPPVAGPHHANLVVNGNFRAGNTGFTSDYAFDPTEVSADGSFTIGADPHSAHSGGASFAAHTKPGGAMLIVNGNAHPGNAVWQQIVRVKPHHAYYFGVWAASWGEGGPSGNGYTSDPNPARLILLVNGKSAGGPFQLEARDGVWDKFAAPWSSGGESVATLRIVDANVAWFGNDFAIDEIVFHD